MAQSVNFSFPIAQLQIVSGICLLSWLCHAWSYPCHEEAAAAAAAAAANDVAENLPKVRICLNGVAQVPASISISNSCQLAIYSLDRELANKFSLYACVQPVLWFGVPVHFDHGKV